MKISALFKIVFHSIRSLFFNGLLIILPVTLTFLLMSASAKLVSKWIEPLHYWLPETFQQIPYAEVALAFIFVFVTGAILKIFVLDPVVHLIERSIVLKIPLVSPIYSGIKQLVSALTTQEKKASLNTVVVLEFPRSGVYAIGFLTGKIAAELSPHTQEEFHSIFIPTTPNPTSGYLAIVATSQFKIVDLSRQEAMALIISGGIVQPNRFMQSEK